MWLYIEDYIYLLHRFEVKGNEMTLQVKEKRVKCAKYIWSTNIILFYIFYKLTYSNLFLLQLFI